MAPDIRYINQSAPFWDFVANLEDQGHPFFNRFSEAGPSSGPWGGWSHHRGHGIPHRGPPGPPNPPGHHGPPPYQSNDQQAEASPSTVRGDTDAEMKEKDDPVPDPPEDAPPAPPGDCPRRGRGRCGGAGRRWHPHHGGPHHHRGGPHSSPPPPPHGGPFPHGFPFHGHGGGGGPRAGFNFLSNLFNPTEAGADEAGDFTPSADVFDTETAYVVHLSLPGAKKEDIGVSWDPEKSELTVAGVVHRPGDEEFLKTLALDERKVGAFERKIRLGTRASPAAVDVDGITAKLENGILVVDVPKLNGEFVEVRKVDIE